MRDRELERALVVLLCGAGFVLIVGLAAVFV